MFGFGGMSFSSTLFAQAVEGVGVYRIASMVDVFNTFIHTPIGEIVIRATSVWTIIFCVVVVAGKNSNVLLERFKPTYGYLIALIVLYVVGIYNLSGFSEFLYFNF